LGDLSFVHLARQVALERAYVIRVANENSWDVALKIAIDDTLDPISELLRSKRESTRLALVLQGSSVQAAKSVRKIHVALFANFSTKLTICVAAVALESRNWCIITSTVSEYHVVSQWLKRFDKSKGFKESESRGSKVLGESCKTVTIGIEIAEERNSFVSKELNLTNGQTRSEALSIYARGRKLAREGVSAFGDIGSNHKSHSREFLSGKSFG
ncbi:10448_t:CDS:2, partial [Scutellospora calospora]